MMAEEKNKFVIVTLVLLVIFAARFILPWKNINWGKIRLLSPQTVTVTGEAKSYEQSQIARFSAGVSAENADKNIAVDEVNLKISKIIDSLKEFGIDEKDIQTQNVSTYQREEPVDVFSKTRSQEKKWFVNNSVSITLRDVNKASELINLLNNSEATEANGPNFSLEETGDIETKLLESAIENARKKAEKIAEASGRKLGEVVNVVEGQSNPVFRATDLEDMTSSSTPIEPGSEQVLKTVTVTFEFK